jgi:hypothetical protein
MIISNVKEVISWFTDMVWELYALGAYLTVDICPYAEVVWLYLRSSKEEGEAMYDAHFYVCTSMYKLDEIERIQHDLLEYRERYKERAKA